MRTTGMLLIVALLVGGCAALKQAKVDYDVGKTAPLAENEISPRAAADALVEPIKPFLPTPLQPLAGVAVTILAAIGAWRRGRRIRLAQVTTTSPITGPVGNAVGLETVVQHATTIIRGATEVGPEGSGLRRGWKVLLALIAGAAAASTGIPAVREFIMSHPDAFGAFALIVSSLAGVEKEVSKVLPVKPSEPTTPA